MAKVPFCPSEVAREIGVGQGRPHSPSPSHPARRSTEVALRSPTTAAAKRLSAACASALERREIAPMEPRPGTDTTGGNGNRVVRDVEEADTIPDYINLSTSR